eukprot:gene13192-19025_t
MSALLASRQSTLVSKAGHLYRIVPQLYEINAVKRNPAGVSRATAFRSQPRPFTGVAKATSKTPDFLELLMEDEIEEEDYALDGDDEVKGPLVDYAPPSKEEAAPSAGKAMKTRTLGQGETIDLTEFENDDDDKNADMDEDILAAMAYAKQVMKTKDYETLIEGDLGLSGNAEDLFGNVLETNSADDVFLAALGADAPEVTEIEDYQGPGGIGKYDEQEGIGMSAEEQDFLSDYKLDRSQLAKIVPEDWDSLIMDWDDNTAEEIPLPEYRLVFLWQEKALAVAIDQVFSKGQTSPLTEYFFWPRKDAWEDLRLALEGKPWITDGDKSLLLNRLTQVIGLWQDESSKRTISEARVAFPDCVFVGA